MARTDYDLVIIGAGAAGLIAARFAAQLGARVLLAERDRIGGDCTWTGCVPSKSLIRVAKAAHEIRTARRFGVDAGSCTVNMTMVRDYVQRTVQEIILLVVFLGIFNAISMTVMERTGEIGTLRANGESRLEIAAGHVLEAAAIGIAGGLLGLALAWFLATFVLADGVAMPPAPGITRSFRIRIELDAREGLQVLALCVATAVAGCVLPVWRATRLEIAQALRHTS